MFWHCLQVAHELAIFERTHVAEWGITTLMLLTYFADFFIFVCRPRVCMLCVLMQDVGYKEQLSLSRTWSCSDLVSHGVLCRSGLARHICSYMRVGLGRYLWTRSTASELCRIYHWPTQLLQYALINECHLVFLHASTKCPYVYSTCF